MVLVSRVRLLAVLLAAAGLLVCVGVSLLSVPVGVTVGGVLLAAWSWLVVAE